LQIRNSLRITLTLALSRPFDTAPSFDTPGHSSGLLRIERAPTQDRQGAGEGIQFGRLLAK